MSTRKSLEQRISELDAKRQALVARQRKEQRTKDLRRKILLGALVLHKINQDGEPADRICAWLQRELPGYLARPADLSLFDDIMSATAAPAATEDADANDQE